MVSHFDFHTITCLFLIHKNLEGNNIISLNSQIYISKLNFVLFLLKYNIYYDDSRNAKRNNTHFFSRSVTQGGQKI